jgi:hypothetical protein
MFLRESITANSHEGKFLFRLGQYNGLCRDDARFRGRSLKKLPKFGLRGWKWSLKRKNYFSETQE